MSPVNSPDKSVPEPIYQYFGPRGEEGVIIGTGDAKDAYKLALQARDLARSAGNNTAILKEDGGRNVWSVWIDGSFSEGYGLGVNHCYDAVSPLVESTASPKNFPTPPGDSRHDKFLARIRCFISKALCHGSETSSATSSMPNPSSKTHSEMTHLRTST